MISTLESLAVLLALKCFFQGRNSEHDTKVQILPTWTDNRGNGSVLNKLMTTRYPASAVLMEMSVFMKRHKLKTNVEWAPREANKEADELANGDVHEKSFRHLLLSFASSYLSCSIVFPSSSRRGLFKAGARCRQCGHLVVWGNHYPQRTDRPIVQ